MSKVKISEVTSDLIRENLKMGQISTVVKTIISESKELNTFNYCDFEAYKVINLLQISLIDGKQLDVGEGEVDIYQIYDEIVNTKIEFENEMLSIPEYIQYNIKNYFEFEEILSSTKERIEKQFDNNGMLEQQVGEFIDKITVTIDKVSDKKYTNSIIKTFLSNAPKELTLSIAGFIDKVKTIDFSKLNVK